MKYPCLVNKRMCKTEVEITIYGEGLSKTGSPVILLDGIKKTCNYQDKSKTIFTKEKKEVTITGIALFPGDIAPNVEELSSGIVSVFGVEREIAQGTKARNPDGTVNYTKLELI